MVYYKSDGIVISFKYNFYITSCHDIAGKLHIWHEATLTHSLTPNNPQPAQYKANIMKTNIKQ